MMKKMNNISVGCLLSVFVFLQYFCLQSVKSTVNYWSSANIHSNLKMYDKNSRFSRDYCKCNAKRTLIDSVVHIITKHFETQ